MVPLPFINRRVLVIALLVISMQSEGQTTSLDGLYITINTKGNCSNLAPLLIGKGNYCISEEPIINAAEIESVSEVQIIAARKQKVMMLKFSANGFRVWNGVMKNLPNAVLVLVIDGYSVATFKNNGGYSGNPIPITAPSDSMELEWIHDHIKKG